MAKMLFSKVDYAEPLWRGSNLGLEPKNVFDIVKWLAEDKIGPLTARRLLEQLMRRRRAREAYAAQRQGERVVGTAEDLFTDLQEGP